MAELTPELRVLRAKMGGLALAASHDLVQYTAKARKAFLAKFEAQVDPGRVLSETERARRAEAARRAYFASLAFKSAKARARH
jgi:hypothetical protein